MAPEKLKAIIEAALLASERPLSADRILNLFHVDEMPTKQDVNDALDALRSDCEERGLELLEVSTGYRYQVRQEYGEWINRMFEERAPRYSRALLETLALVCYKQPITRAEVEDVRGVAVSTNIIRTLLDREWIKLVGHRDVPGKPALYGTTRKLLDDLNLKKLDELPPLADIRDIDQIPGELNLIHQQEKPADANEEADSGADTSKDETEESITVASISLIERDEVDVDDDKERIVDESEENVSDEDADTNDSDSQQALADENTEEETLVAEEDSESHLSQAATS